MKIEVGRYEMDLDFDPRIQNNASDTMVPIDDIGFIYNCVFKQKKAFEYSVEAIRRVIETQRFMWSLMGDLIIPIWKMRT